MYLKFGKKIDAKRVILLLFTCYAGISSPGKFAKYLLIKNAKVITRIIYPDFSI